ncbi:DUF4875 domain-containing protein [Desulfovibrio sp. OttesenSCG-928-G11]|nr:DUF4875 domain-containing protein [Desulfovibrio sp. OttesenSCG-928-G11]
MAFTLYLLAFACLAGLLFFFKKPSFTPFRSGAVAIKTTAMYLGLFICFFLLAGTVSGPDEQSLTAQTAKTAVTAKAGQRPDNGLLQWEEVLRREVPMQNGRDRLELLIAPLGDQSGALHRDLLSTATDAAVKVQAQSGVPVVIVSLAPRKNEKPGADPLLAHVVYIPDGKGFDGDLERQPQWETLRAAKRGFSDAELEYLLLWQELRKDFQGRSGLQLKELDVAVSEKLGLAPGTLTPFENRLEDEAATK